VPGFRYFFIPDVIEDPAQYVCVHTMHSVLQYNMPYFMIFVILCCLTYRTHHPCDSTNWYFSRR